MTHTSFEFFFIFAVNRTTKKGKKSYHFCYEKKKVDFSNLFNLLPRPSYHKTFLFVSAQPWNYTSIPWGKKLQVFFLWVFTDSTLYYGSDWAFIISEYHWMGCSIGELDARSQMSNGNRPIFPDNIYLTLRQSHAF